MRTAQDHTGSSALSLSLSAQCCAHSDALTAFSQHANGMLFAIPRAGGVMRAWRVLVIDDSEIALEVERSALEQAGFEVRALRGPSQLGETDGWIPDVVLTDVDMPDMTGPEVCALLKQRYHAQVRVVLCSGMSPAALAELASSCNADGFISKDSIEEMVGEVRCFCEGALW